MTVRGLGEEDERCRRSRKEPDESGKSSRAIIQYRVRGSAFWARRGPMLSV